MGVVELRHSNMMGVVANDFKSEPDIHNMQLSLVITW